MAAQRVTIRAARHHDVRPSSWHDRNIEFRPFGPRDQPAILGLLSGLSTIYPDSAGWLRRRLTDTLEHRARCTVAVLDDVPVAVLIESPKGPTEIKLSTLYVAPEYRRLGIATHLIALARSRWMRNGVDRVYVTMDRGRSDLVYRFFGSKGFVKLGEVRDRYGPGRAELIMQWRPE